MKLTQLFESISHENILQNIATACIEKIASSTFDSRGFNCGKLKSFIPTKTLGALYTRLANIELDVVNRDDKNSGIFSPGTPGSKYDLDSVILYTKLDPNNQFNSANIPHLKGTLVHELRHALDHSLRKRLAFSNKQAKGTSPVADGSTYLKQSHEINARVSEVANAISTDLIKHPQLYTTDETLSMLVLTMCDRYKLSHIFNTTNSFAKEEEFTMFGRPMERSHPMFSPMDNKQFRRIFNRLFAFAKTKLSTPV